MADESNIIRMIEEDLLLLKDCALSNIGELGNEWARKMLMEPPRFISEDYKIKKEALENFRGSYIFVPDLPIGQQSVFNLLNIVDGARRGHVKMLKGALSVLKLSRFDSLLKKYPCSRTGNPNIFRYKGYKFTFRWIKHIYALGLFKKHLAPQVEDDFTTLDLGSSYGMYSALLKKEYGKSHHVLIDFPEQLALARYYIGREFPRASIATYRDIRGMGKIDRDFIKKYDFLLIPYFLYTKLSKGSIDIFTNFTSLQEMGRSYFDYYLKNEPFLSSKFFFTINRYNSAPTYDNGITISDYPLKDFTASHFSTSLMISRRYRRRLLFFYTSYPYPKHFEFIGNRKQVLQEAL